MKRRIWNENDYRVIQNIDRVGHDLTVRFANGDTVTLDGRRLVPAGTSGIRWESLTHDEDELQVPSDHGIVEIPAFRVRELTDDALADHLQREAQDQPAQIGQRIRSLRRQHGLTSTALAKQAGIDPQTLSRIEHGKHDLRLTTLHRLLSAMGCSYVDLADPLEIPAPA